ncbi:DUF4381 domain-containing protein [uncultured Lamprocystis sp.]|jgi:hypothetical protein|uniref:DUF4381 domain-containing protein n=1 Tax=uncultured Lamprocystis sp. TaxID=543132 RepID=UPI0025D0963D|nr:DUF4381 domain-containing protein [uncultured Lamprocystis sp.]
METDLIPALDRLRDIHGIAGVPWWPPAPGWWLLLGAGLLLGLAAWRWRTLLTLRLPIPGITLGTWRWAAAAALRGLRRRVRGGADAKAALGELSELLRRIAMARLGRPACAGLTGETWLAWLAAHDPAGFPWTEHGRLLLAAPYAPSVQAGPTQLLTLIDAVYAWVAAPAATRPESGRV